MEKEHVNQFIAMHGNKFTQEVLPSVKRKVESVPDERFDELCAIDFKSPTTMLIIAILLGYLPWDYAESWTLLTSLVLKNEQVNTI